LGITVAGSDRGRGEAAVTLGAGEEREVERIPEQLRRFLGGSQNSRVIYLII
jgi:protein involved in ribonucleotide reduction